MMTTLHDLPACHGPLAKVDARWKLAALLLSVAAVGLGHALPSLAVACTGALLLTRFARIPWPWLIERWAATLTLLLPFWLLLPWTMPMPMPPSTPLTPPTLPTTSSPTPPLLEFWGPLPLSPLGVETAGRITLKALTIVTLMLILLATAPLPTTLRAAHALRIPGIFVQLTLLAYRYLFLLASELTRLRIALRVRGFRWRTDWHSYRTLGCVVGTLLVRGADRAEQVAQAMRCRGFDGQFRTLNTFRTTWRDVGFFTIISSGTLAWILWDWALRGHL